MILTQYQRACLICAPELIYSFRLRMYIFELKVKRFINKKNIMLTIEEAAHEYFRRGQLGLASACSEYGFIAGVEFAQQWIDVKDKLPTEENFYFVKVKNSFPKDCNIVVAKFYDDNNTFYDENSDYPIEDAISWRPIEYK